MFDPKLIGLFTVPAKEALIMIKQHEPCSTLVNFRTGFQPGCKNLVLGFLGK